MSTKVVCEQMMLALSVNKTTSNIDEARYEFIRLV